MRHFAWRVHPIPYIPTLQHIYGVYALPVLLQQRIRVRDFRVDDPNAEELELYMDKIQAVPTTVRIEVEGDIEESVGSTSNP